MKFYSTYKFRFIFLITLFITLVCAAITIVAVRDIRSTAVKVFAERGVAVIEKAEPYIDPVRFAELCRTLDADDSYYLETWRNLFDIKQSLGCEYLYTMVPKSGTVFTYIVDGSSTFDDEDNFSPLGTDEDISSYGSYPFDALKRQEMVVGNLQYQADWGWTISVYAPIIDAAGTSIGFLACDFDVENLVSVINGSTIKMILVFAVSLVVGITALWFFVVFFFKRLFRVVQAMRDIAGGASDLTARIPCGNADELDALAAECNAVIEQMQRMIRTVSQSVGTLSENSGEISGHNQEMLSLLSEAGTAIDEIYGKAGTQCGLTEALSGEIGTVRTAVQTLEEKIAHQTEAAARSSLAVEQITSNIHTADMNISRIADEYGAIVDETAKSRQKQNKMTEQISLIAQQAKNLSTANSVVTKIAAQTNLLAMNAAIEAAHAGDSGRGFSVVADEIRALAETSAKQTKAIRTLIGGIEKTVEELVDASGNSESSFGALGNRIGELAVPLQEIRVGMNGQNRGAEDIIAMMRVLSNSAEAIADASKKMSDETLLVSEKITELRKSADDILSSGSGTAELLNQVNTFAANAAVCSDGNVTLAGNVRSLVASYKVE
ncbi:methyl-accepting chemotaxis protein [Treponema brennaborense]|uniref:Methyl-accepting chemotaxis sensory transducer n=1 Tax=Treponema brennaborense (strain DSM 12168 / CIP 105900 / DD5/3) TaxID=906968 RepID=F4LMF5_TREBD|nr:methyl-accepting chemotaxis protein [Treponema brennaborense]AEE15717.1 methyl-accepting chemotaxis sensory transducer [Treponema brennaborense DSM 12168]